MSVTTADWAKWIRESYPGWHLDEPKPSTFYTKNDGVIIWLQYSRYRLRLTQNDAAVFFGPSGKKPIHKLDYRNTETFTTFLDKLHKANTPDAR